MDALRVVIDDLMFRARIPHCRFLPLLVTLAAEDWNIDGEDRRLRIRAAFDFMCAVAFLARRPVRIIVRYESSVHTALILLADLGMA